MYSWFDAFDSSVPDTRALRNAFSAFATGVCLVTTISDDGKSEGMTINSFASVSLQPSLLLWSIRNDARSADAFLSNGRFTISVLTAQQHALALHFARPAEDKFAQYTDAFETELGNCPRLRESVATFQCSTYSCHKEGDHTIIVGKVEQFSSSLAAPLVARAGKLGTLDEIA